MMRYCVFIAISAFLVAKIIFGEDDMSSSNMGKLKDSKHVAAEKEWSCNEVKKEMKKKGKIVVDCMIREGNPWYRIDDGLTWEEAFSACRLIPGSDLASIHNIDEFNYLRYLFWMPENDRTANWVGLNDIVDEGKYKWTDGTSSDYLKWIVATKEPNGEREENCVMYQQQVAGGGCCLTDGLVDFKCSYELPAICKIVNPAKE